MELDESTVFLIPLDDGYLLFDTGYPWDYETFVGAIGARKIPALRRRDTVLSEVIRRVWNQNFTLYRE